MGGGGGVVVAVRPGGGVVLGERDRRGLSGQGWDSRRKMGDRGGVLSRGRGVQRATVTTRIQNCTNVTRQGEVKEGYLG